VTCATLPAGATSSLASYFLDATELGDLLPLTRTEYVTGSSRRRKRRTARPGGGPTAQPPGVYLLLRPRLPGG